MNPSQICYALAKQLPAMKRGAVILTDYGEINLDNRTAARVAEFMAPILRHELNKLQRQAAATRRRHLTNANFRQPE